MALPIERKSDPARDEWYTPAWLFDAMGLKFALDPCSPGAARVPWIPAARHITREEDGLAASWSGTVWCNPPYSDVATWADKFRAHGDGVFLSFARVETRWFQALARDSSILFFPSKRVRFQSASGDWSGYPAAPSVLVGIGREACTALANMEKSGHGLAFGRERSW